MLIIVIFNAGLMMWENYKRINELPVKLEITMQKIKGSYSTKVNKRKDLLVWNYINVLLC